MKIVAIYSFALVAQREFDQPKFKRKYTIRAVQIYHCGFYSTGEPTMTTTKAAKWNGNHCNEMQAHIATRQRAGPPVADDESK